MLTRRTFVTGALGLTAGVARAAPLPDAVARQSGIFLNTWDGCVLALTETGRVARAVRFCRPYQHGVYAHVVSPDGRAVALTGPLNGRPGDPNPLVAYPLTDRPVPRPLTTPAQFVDAWSADGTSVIASHFTTGHSAGSGYYFRTFQVDLATGRCTDLGMPESRPQEGGGFESPYRVMDWSADGRWFLARRYGADGQHQPFVLVPAAGGAFRPLDLDPTHTPRARFSPDSRRLLTVRDEPWGGPVRELPPAAGPRFDCVVEVRSLDGGAATEVGRWAAREGESNVGVSACWRADGRRVAVLAQRRGDSDRARRSALRPTGELVTLDPDGGNRRVVREWVGDLPFGLLGWV